MSANRSAYILATVRDILDAETTFDVVKVWRESPSLDKATVYPFILNQTFTEYSEDGYNTGYGTASVNVIIHQKVTGDPAREGTNTDKYGEIVQKVEELIENATWPVYEAHTGNLFKTAIHDIRILSWDGQFDNGDTKVNIGCLLNIDFTHTKV